MGGWILGLGGEGLKTAFESGDGREEVKSDGREAFVMPIGSARCVGLAHLCACVARVCALLTLARMRKQRKCRLLKPVDCSNWSARAMIDKGK